VNIISIIVPIYNTANYLEKCIDSVLKQSYNNLEVILVNDGSTDNSIEICKKYHKIDNRISIIDKKNGGLASARNAGLDIAKGNYYGFIDSDDYIHPNMFEELINALTKYNADISMCGRTIVRNNKEHSLFTLNNPAVWSGKEAFSKLLLWDNIDTSSCDKLFKKNLFKEKRFPFGMIGEDAYIIPEIISNANILVHIGKPMYYWFQRSDSISNSMPTIKSFSDLMKSYKKIAGYSRDKYPDLCARSDHYFLKPIFWMVLRCYGSRRKFIDNNAKIYIINEFKTNILKMLCNPFFSFIEKIKLVLIYTNLYGLLVIIKKQIRF